MSKSFNKCIFFDRDGVLNKDKGYISKVNDIEIFSKVGQAIHECNKNKYLVIIITNQSGIGRGLISLKQLNQIHSYIKKEIKKNKAIINDIFFCPFIQLLAKVNIKEIAMIESPILECCLKQLKNGKLTQKKVL
jgi:histidinol-phosphate phosphatase family protein